MAIVFMCPRCDRKYSVSDAMAGRRATCKACGQEQTVPAARPAPVQEAAADFDELDGPDQNDDPGNPYAQDFDDLPPRKPAGYDDDRPAKPSARRKKKASKGIGDYLPDSGKKIAIAAFAIVAALLAFSVVSKAMQNNAVPVQPGAFTAMFVIVVIIAAIIGMIICGLANLGIILSEDGPIVLIACFIIPLVGLIYTIKNWDKTAKWIGGQIVCIAAMFGCIYLMDGMNGPKGQNGFANALNNVNLPQIPNPNDAVNQANPFDPNAFSPEDGIVVLATGLDEEAKWRVFGGKLGEIGKAQVPGQFMMMMSPAGDEKSFRIGPKRDAQDFANRINFGTVTSVQGNVVRVRQNLPEDEVAIVRNQLAQEKAKNVAAAAAVPPPIGGIAAANPAMPAPPKVDTNTIDGALETIKSTRDHFKISDAIKRLAYGIPPGRRAEVVAALTPLLTDRNIFTVKDTLNTLTALKEPESVPAIMEILDRKEMERDAIEALGAIKDPRAAAAIADRLESAWPAAERALIAMGPAAEPAAMAKLRDPVSGIRAGACKVLAEIGGAESLKLMKKLPADPDFGVQVAARDAMQKIAARTARSK